MKNSAHIGRKEGVLLVTLVTLVLGLSVALRDHARSPTIDEPNRAFAEGRYAQAASRFEEIQKSEGYSAPLLFNQGNASLRDGKPVRAILAYERARLLAPHDAAIATNLAVARTAASVADPHSWLDRASHLLPMDDWTWLAAGSFWFTVGALGTAWLARRGRGAWAKAAGGFGVLAAAALLAVTVASRDLHRALILEAAPVLVSPFDTARSDATLQAGTEVKLGSSRDDYVFVEGPDGHTGWVERAQLEPLIPSCS